MFALGQGHTLAITISKLSFKPHISTKRLIIIFCSRQLATAKFQPIVFISHMLSLERLLIPPPRFSSLSVMAVHLFGGRIRFAEFLRHYHVLNIILILVSSLALGDYVLCILHIRFISCTQSITYGIF